MPALREAGDAVTARVASAVLLVVALVCELVLRIRARRALDASLIARQRAIVDSLASGPRTARYYLTGHRYGRKRHRRTWRVCPACGERCAKPGVPAHRVVRA